MGDVYNYVFAHDQSSGHQLDEGVQSNQYAWICDEASGDLAGLALSNPRFRWRDSSQDYTCSSRSIGYDLKFHHAAITGNRLYLTVAMKFDSLAVGEEVATIKLKVLDNVSSKSVYTDYTGIGSNYYEFVLHPVNSEVGTTSYNNTYSSVPRDDIEYGRNILFEYYIEFPDPVFESDLYNRLLVNSWSGDFFLHINPEIYWHGNGRMELDYIVLEDSYHRQARMDGTSSSVFNMLSTRMNQILALPNGGNICYHYTKDEPFQGQFAMYDALEEGIDALYGSYNSPKLLTATHLEGYNVLKPNEKPYEHYLNFLSQAKPKTVALDAYPLQERSSSADDLIIWNSNMIDDRSVQQRINRLLTTPYKNLTRAVRYHNTSAVRETEIIFIPQIFGEFETDSAGAFSRWRYFMPPRGMISCLQFLPLCYSSDGILDFTLLAADSLYG